MKKLIECLKRKRTWAAIGIISLAFGAPPQTVSKVMDVVTAITTITSQTEPMPEY